jgi:hypothetical protein
LAASSPSCFWPGRSPGSGRLDECIAGFDRDHPECTRSGYGAAEGAREVHDAYGAAGEVIGGAIGMVAAADPDRARLV